MGNLLGIRIKKFELPRLDKGFTLIEVLVALAIITIALTSVYRLQGDTFRMSGDARFYTLAPMLAKTQLAELESKGMKNAGDGSGDFGDEFPGYEWSVSLEEIQSDFFKEKKHHLTRINLTISLNETLTYELRTYRYYVD